MYYSDAGGSDQDGEEINDEDLFGDEEDVQTIDEAFKNLRWTRVISLRDYKE